MSKRTKQKTEATKAQRVFCPCGGEVKMITLGTGGKLRHCAECLKCGQRRRKPSDF